MNTPTCPHAERSALHGLSPQDDVNGPGDAAIGCTFWIDPSGSQPKNEIYVKLCYLSYNSSLDYFYILDYSQHFIAKTRTPPQVNRKLTLVVVPHIWLGEQGGQARLWIVVEI